jgi:hypothetical protein
VLANALTTLNRFLKRGKADMNTQYQNRSSELAADALKALIRELEAGNTEALTNYLSVMARFHKYSWNNCLLIALQKAVT